MTDSYDMLEQMTDEELITAHRLGNKEAIEVLVKRYKRFVRHKIKANFFIGADKEDLIQEGMIGLYKAICDYNMHKEASFKSFASICISRQISTAFKSVSRQKHIPLNSSISLNIPISNRNSDEDEENITLMDVIKMNGAFTPEDELIDQENVEILNENIKKKLSSLEWQVLELHTQGKNYHEIAKELDKSVKSIDNALQRIKKKLDIICYPH
ncbi:RNA polymerase factor sigma-70 [Sporanaerobium hydrogeniformans]|uniref:RNA polymerase factor sigma-70 n=1 Tax=Sporanaerobium hydrogeniformans TaxID=3072179 RepID=A0AC61DHE5_9FIRM|nr:RNA polymerase sporulation sigma factor SigH [Sporanaerobium hydrogeniformans]PHV71947.1 RNA polymerase factor sigma-70 [Sporanaerobium hydrogeniformans]